MVQTEVNTTSKEQSHSSLNVKCKREETERLERKRQETDK